MDFNPLLGNEAVNAGIKDIGSSFAQGWDTSSAIMSQLEERRKQNKLNVLYKNALNPDGTIDQNKLLQGAKSLDLGTTIPDLIKQGQERTTQEAVNKDNQMKLSLNRLSLVGQVMGSVTTKAEYDMALEKLKSEGLDTSLYPPVNTDAEATKTGAVAYWNAISATNQMQNQTTLSQIEQNKKEASDKAITEQLAINAQATKDKDIFNETNRHNIETEKSAKIQADAAAAKAGRAPVTEYEKIASKKKAEYDVVLGVELKKNEKLKSLLDDTVKVGGKPVNKIENLINESYSTLPTSLIGRGVSAMTGKDIGGNKATNELAMLGAKILATIPFAPGSQSNLELAARQKQVGDISNPSIATETRLALFKDLQKYANSFEKNQPAIFGDPYPAPKINVPNINTNSSKLIEGIPEIDHKGYQEFIKTKGLK